MEFYDFIMISDYFDESLILLKEKFCLDWEDVLVFSKNVGSRKSADISTGMSIRINCVLCGLPCTILIRSKCENVKNIYKFENI